MPRLSAPLLALGMLAGCDPHLPGEVVGAYSVVMHLEDSDCGSGVAPFVDGQRYAVELRSEGSVGYWRLSKAPPVSGTYDAPDFAFRYTEAIELGQADAGTSGCTVLREEALEGTIQALTSAPGAHEADAGSTLAGAHEVTFRVDPNGRCRDARGPLREFEQLPCRARYRLDGTPRAPF